MDLGRATTPRGLIHFKPDREMLVFFGEEDADTKFSI
jgi:hypothetical protein